MKKLISLLLTLLMVFSVVSPVMVSAAYTVDNVGDPSINSPLVYIRGAGKNLYNNDIDRDDEIIYPVSVDVEAIIEELDLIGVDLIFGLISDDYGDYIDRVYNLFAPIFEDVVFGKDCNKKDNSGNGKQDPIPNKQSGFKVWDNDFGYDFRVDLVEVAGELDAYIKEVKRTTGKEKVTLLGRCLATNLIAAYLTFYKEEAKKDVENVILYVPATDGVDLISKLFSGKLEVQSDNLDEFADFFINNKKLIEDPVMVDFITVLLEFLEYAKVLGLSMDAFQLLVDRLQGELIPKLGLASFVSFPSYWSMVNPEDFEDAKKLVFAGQEEEYAGLIEKIDRYHEKVQIPFTDLMKELKEGGMDFSIIAKYNIPNIPISAASRQLGDFLSSTKQLSYGATCADHGLVLTQKYIDSLADKKYLSPDLKVDASTCLFPDNTWFMKNSLHDHFPDDGNRLIAELVNKKGEVTVWESESFPQYVEYVEVEGEEEGIFVPVEGMDPVKPEKGSDEERASLFIRFFTAILNFFTKLFNGDFENLFKKGE